MKTTNTDRSRLATRLLAGIVATGIASYALAASDYDRIKKDITMMVSIVKTAFENSEECKRCGVTIDGHYLADQGIVFDVTPRGNSIVYSVDGDTNYDFEFHSDGVAEVPGLVNQILADVEASLGNINISGYAFTDGENLTDINDEVREELREARLEMREMEREMRELEIEAIHSEGERLKELEQEEKQIRSRMGELTEREKKLQKDVSVFIAKRKQERDARLAERQAEVDERFNRIETVVLNTFCDYSRTMRNLPRGERVSIIMKKSGDEAKIYVLEKDEIESCDSGKTDLRTSALSYAF